MLTIGLSSRFELVTAFRIETEPVNYPLATYSLLNCRSQNSEPFEAFVVKAAHAVCDPGKIICD